MKKIILLLILFGIVMIPVNADSFVEPKYFEVASKEGNRIFKWNPTDDFSNPPIVQVVEDDKIIYTIDGTSNLGTSKQSFYFSNNMDYIVYEPVADQDNALHFYNKGELIKSYRIEQLVKDLDKITYSETMAFWTHEEKPIEFDQNNNTLKVTTVDNIEYLFDITTGEYQNQNEVNILGYILIGIIGLAVGYVALKLIDNRKNKIIEKKITRK